jgi:hypothetical protein
MASKYVNTTAEADEGARSSTTPQPFVKRLAPHYSRMLTIGVAHVRISYTVHEGIWEASGQAFDASMRPVDGGMTRTTINDVVRIFFQLLSIRHPNWQEGRGSFGTLIWDLPSNDLEHRHHHRGTVLETHIHRGM